MASVVELTAYCKKIIDLEQLIEELSQLNYVVELISAEIIDDWEYNNYQDVTNCYNRSEIIENILSGKIFIGRLKVNSKFNVGYRALINSDKSFEVSVWLDTEEINYLDSDRVTLLNKVFYDNFTSKFLHVVNTNSLILAGIGVETFIEYNNDILSIIRSSKNIFRWIVPYYYSLPIEMLNFDVEKIGNFRIYSVNQDLS